MNYQPQIILDGKPVEKITAFLFQNGGNDDPKKIISNADKSFQGSIVLGMGFALVSWIIRGGSEDKNRTALCKGFKNRKSRARKIRDTNLNSVN